MACVYRKRFTLVELLVVIAVIGILMTMLLPSLRNARTASMTAISISNLKQIYAGCMSYAKSNRQFLMKTNNNPHEEKNDNQVNYSRLVFEEIQGETLGRDGVGHKLKINPYYGLMFCPVIRVNRGIPTRFGEQGPSDYSMNKYFRNKYVHLAEIDEGEKEPFISPGTAMPSTQASTTLRNGTYNPDDTGHPSYEYLNTKSIGLYIDGSIKTYTVTHGTSIDSLINEDDDFQ